MTPNDFGVLRLKSPFSVKDSVDKFEALLRTKGVTTFARIDQTEAARRVGLDLPPTELLIFGNPIAGTPVMTAFPLAGLDLPLKLLAWEESGVGVWLTYNDPAYLQHRYGLPEEMAKKLDVGPLVRLIAG